MKVVGSLASLAYVSVSGSIAAVAQRDREIMKFEPMASHCRTAAFSQVCITLMFYMYVSHTCNVLRISGLNSHLCNLDLCCRK